MIYAFSTARFQNQEGEEEQFPIFGSSISLGHACTEWIYQAESSGLFKLLFLFLSVFYLVQMGGFL